MLLGVLVEICLIHIRRATSFVLARLLFCQPQLSIEKSIVVLALSLELRRLVLVEDVGMASGCIVFLAIMKAEEPALTKGLFSTEEGLLSSPLELFLLMQLL